MSELAKAVVRIEGNITGLESALTDAQSQMEEAGKGFEKLGATLFHKVTLALVAAAAAAVHEFGEEADAVTRLSAVLEAAGGVTGATTAHVEQLAHQLQETTRFFDDTTIGAATMLGTFHQVRNELGAGNQIFDRALKASADLASVMGEDLSEAAFKVGRALEDPANSLMLLRRSGIVFNAVEREQIKIMMEHGQIAEAQRIILDRIESKFKGVSEEMAKTPFGHFIQMWNAIRDAVKPIGGILASVLVPLADMVKGLANAFKALPSSVQVVIVVIGALVAALGPALLLFANVQKIIIFVRAMMGFQAALTGWLIVSRSVKVALLALLTPVGLVSAAVAVIAVMWVRAQMAAHDAAVASQEATDKLIAGFAALSPEQVQARIKRLGTVISSYQDKVDSLRTSLIQTAVVQSSVADATATTMPSPVPQGLTPEQQAQAKAQIEAYNELIGKLKVAQQALKDLGVGFKDAATRANDELTAALMDADHELDVARVSAQALGAVLGPTFNVAGADAQAFQTHMQTVTEKLARAGKSAQEIADAIRHEGEQWRASNLEAAVHDLDQAFQAATKSAEVMGDMFGFSFDKAGALADAVRQKIQSIITAMTAAGKSPEEIATAVAGLAAQLQELERESQIGAFFKDEFGKATDAVVDFAFNGTQSITEFVRSALADFAKLILRIEAMKLALSLTGGGDAGALFPGEGAITGHAHGGFIGPGELGLVGETGPELVRAGRSGLMVAPLTEGRGTASSGMDSDGGRVTVPVAITVNAIDSRDTARFFNENEGLVANAVMKAMMKSRALQRRMG